MCKCCDYNWQGNEFILNSRKLGRYTECYPGIDVSISDKCLYVQACTEAANGGIEYIEQSTEIDFCPKCGTPLGEIKPLTVEQLREMDGKPVYVIDKERREKLWCIISFFKSKFAAEIAGCDHFWYEEKDYGTTWICFDREPKGETE